ncbi:MAG TPA: tail fiber domain-containing protein, partial [Verrucomicrobiae bacterium]|nr:tail fiber domain-containing protein [Verrucomicrobiae bacterium]
KLTAAPYAFQSLSASNLLGGLPATQLTGIISTSVLPGFQGSDNAIGGGVGNFVNGSQSAILGGQNNTNSANQSSIGGGGGNVIQGGSYYSSIGGGGGNLIQGNAYDSFIGSGYHNTIESNAIVSFIGGGQYVTISTNAIFSVAGGGLNNTNVGPFSVIAGGQNNLAGSNSFAAGFFAEATNRGAFVWADASANGFGSVTNNSFNVRAAGGVRLVTGGTGATIDGKSVVTSPIASSALPSSLVTNGESGVTFPNLTLTGPLTLPAGNAGGIEILSAGSDVLIGDNNGDLFLGVDSYSSLSAGDDNTACGDAAMNLESSGYENTAVGYEVLAKDTSSYDNTAVGTMAMYNNTSTGGSENEAIGAYTLYSNNGGYGNVAIGYQAGYHVTSGSGNIAIGTAAGINITTTEGNIDIGNAGTNSDSDIIRIGTSGVQSATYLAGTVYANGVALTSDRNAKENFTPVNPQTVLDKVAALPVSEWNYKTSENIEHIGPMAQDFHAAFGLNGADDKHISVVDEGGVALAAIQGLNEKLEEQRSENAQLKLENSLLSQRLDELESEVKVLAKKN